MFHVRYKQWRYSVSWWASYTIQTRDINKVMQRIKIKKLKKNTKLSAKSLTERRLRNDSVSEGERSLETRPVFVIVKQGSRGGHAGACRVRNKNNELKM